MLFTFNPISGDQYINAIAQRVIGNKAMNGSLYLPSDAILGQTSFTSILNTIGLPFATEHAGHIRLYSAKGEDLHLPNGEYPVHLKEVLAVMNILSGKEPSEDEKLIIMSSDEFDGGYSTSAQAIHARYARISNTINTINSDIESKPLSTAQALLNTIALADTPGYEYITDIIDALIPMVEPYQVVELSTGERIDIKTALEPYIEDLIGHAGSEEVITLIMAMSDELLSMPSP